MSRPKRRITRAVPVKKPVTGRPARPAKPTKPRGIPLDITAHVYVHSDPVDLSSVTADAQDVLRMVSAMAAALKGLARIHNPEGDTTNGT